MTNSEGLVVEILENKDYGVILKCKDLSIADDLEDFLTEECYVFFNVKYTADSVSILFGQASSVERVQALYKNFLARKDSMR